MSGRMADNLVGAVGPTASIAALIGTRAVAGGIPDCEGWIMWTIVTAYMPDDRIPVHDGGETTPVLR